MFRQLNAVIGQAIQHLQSGNSAEAKKKLVYVLNVEPKNGCVQLLAEVDHA